MTEPGADTGRRALSGHTLLPTIQYQASGPQVHVTRVPGPQLLLRGNQVQWSSNCFSVPTARLS